MTVFVDTNVLVYVRDRSEPEKQAGAAEWVARLWETGLGRLSQQVLHEYYVTLTRKLDPPRAVEDARDDVLALHAWRPAPLRRTTVERAWAIEDRYGFAWWDALIVASALETGAAYLLTEDLQHGQRIESVAVVDPFRTGPDEIL